MKHMKDMKEGFDGLIGYAASRASEARGRPTAIFFMSFRPFMVNALSEIMIAARL